MHTSVLRNSLRTNVSHDSAKKGRLVAFLLFSLKIIRYYWFYTFKPFQVATVLKAYQIWNSDGAVRSRERKKSARKSSRTCMRTARWWMAASKSVCWMFSNFIHLTMMRILNITVHLPLINIIAELWETMLNLSSIFFNALSWWCSVISQYFARSIQVLVN